jgi:SOS-response transcriptional repressor LexA
MDLREFEQIKAKVEKTKKELAKAEGVLSEHMRRLKDEFGCSSVEEAEKKLEQLQNKKVVLEEKYTKRLKKFKADWSEKLSG